VAYRRAMRANGFYDSEGRSAPLPIPPPEKFRRQSRRSDSNVNRE
jgi:hypothetical protein